MVRPLSNDLRKRVVAAVSKGESCRSAALRFGVAVSSVAALPSDEFGQTGQDGQAAQVCVGSTWRLHQRADQPDPAFDTAYPERRVGDAWGRRLA